MAAINWTKDLRAIYDKACAKYRAGEQLTDSFFDPADSAFLALIGLRPINVFDHVEDLAKYGQPDWETFLLVAAARRDYFLHIQRGKWPADRIEESSLPAKTDSIGGVEWLPRIARKAVCFLDGSLCEDIMYGCGGDRQFLAKFDVHAADFLRIAWAEHGDPAKILAHIRMN